MTRVAVEIRSGLTVSDVGESYLEHVEFVLEYKPTTLGDYRSIVGKQLNHGWRKAQPCRNGR